MAGIPFKPTARGMDLAEIQSAEWFNAIARLNQMMIALNSIQSGGSVRTGGVDYSQVLIRNNSGAHGPMFGILGIDDGFEISPDDNLDAWKEQPILKGVEPNEDHVGRFVILTQPIPEGEIGSCYVEGIITQIDVTDEDHQFADITAGETGYLTSSTSGLCRIIQKQGPPDEEPEEGEPDLRWALVAYGGVGSCPKNHFKIRTYITTASSRTWSLTILIDGAPCVVSGLSNTATAEAIHDAIMAVSPFSDTDSPYSVEVYGVQLPGSQVGMIFSGPDGTVFGAFRSAQSNTDFNYTIDEMRGG